MTCHPILPLSPPPPSCIPYLHTHLLQQHPDSCVHVLLYGVYPKDDQGPLPFWFRIPYFTYLLIDLQNWLASNYQQWGSLQQSHRWLWRVLRNCIKIDTRCWKKATWRTIRIKMRIFSWERHRVNWRRLQWKAKVENSVTVNLICHIGTMRIWLPFHFSSYSIIP